MDCFKKIKIIDIYLLISLIMLISFVVVNYAMDGEIFSKCVWSSSFLFSDYFYHIAGSSDTGHMYALGDPYTFPPFAYFLYSFLWSLNPYRDGETILNWRNYMNYDNTLVVFVIYNMLCVLLLIYVIIQYTREVSSKYVVLFPMLIITSYPFMCTAIQRGNSTLFVGMIIALSFCWMESNSVVKKEMAMILIAIAAGFKIYPALLGLIYVKRKDWKRACRLILYGCVVLFLPFVFFGGSQGLFDLISTLTGFASYGDPEKTNTIWGIVKYGVLKMNSSVEIADTIGIICQYIFAVLSIVGFFLAKDRWKEAYLISAVLVSFLPSNWDYTLTYYLGAFLLFLISNNGDIGEIQGVKKIGLLFFTFCFAAIFSLDWPMLYFRYGLRTGIFLVTYAIWVVCLLDIMVPKLSKKCSF